MKPEGRARGMAVQIDSSYGDCVTPHKQTGLSFSVGAFRPTPPREVVMKAIHWTIAAASLVIVQPAQAGINDPEVIIYRFPGIRDTGGDVATVFHCTNFSGVLETVRFVI